VGGAIDAATEGKLQKENPFKSGTGSVGGGFI